MALRSARRRNFFLGTLRNQTYAYMKEQNKVVKAQLRKIVVNTKDVVKNAIKRPFYNLTQGNVVRYYHMGKEVSENNSKFGKVFANAEMLPARLREKMNAVMSKYGTKIFAMSQRLVPIDKRYGATVQRKQSRIRSIVAINDIDHTTFKKSLRDPGMRSFRKQYENFKNLIDFKVGSGWYGGNQADFIEKYLNGSNRRSIYNIYYNVKEGKIYNFNDEVILNVNSKDFLSLELKGDKKAGRSRLQPFGGYQELKKGGELKYTGNLGDSTSLSISYSAFDKTRPKSQQYNYAALQHDNLAFKHKYGQALYLSQPVKFYRDKLIKEMRESVAKTIERSK